MGLLLRTVIGIPLLMAIILIMAAGFQVVEPIYDGAQVMQGAESQGWGSGGTIMLFTTLGMAGLIIVLILWWIVGDLTEDPRQRQLGP